MSGLPQLLIHDEQWLSNYIRQFSQDLWVDLIGSHALVHIEVPQLVILLKKVEESELPCSLEGSMTACYGLAEGTRKPSSTFMLLTGTYKQFKRPLREIVSPVLGSNKLTWLLAA